MKHLNKILFLLLIISVFSSCMNTNEVEKTPQCAITSFSVGSISCSVPTKTSQGKDTTETRSLSSKEMKFQIDQVNGIITTVDSMPKWINLKKVTPTFSAYGYVYAKIDSQYYQLTSGSDSLDMTNPVEFLTMATDGVSTKKYTVSFKVYKEDIDTLLWNRVSSTNLKVSGKKKALYNNGKIYLFSADGNGYPQVTSTLSSGNGSNWTEPVAITTPIDYSSVLVYKNDFYALANGNIYKSTTDEDGITWTKVSDDSFTRLLSSDDYYIYAFNGKEIVGSKDGLNTWTVCGTTDIDCVPETCINSYNYVSKTNSNIQIAVMTGITNQSSEHTVAWYKVSSVDKELDQQWMYIRKTIDNPYYLSNFVDMSVARHNNALYAIGLNIYDDTLEYDYLYYSADNGITWIPQTERYILPSEFTADNGTAEIVSDGDRLWLIQNGEYLWTGVIR